MFNKIIKIVKVLLNNLMWIASVFTVQIIAGVTMKQVLLISDKKVFNIIAIVLIVITMCFTFIKMSEAEKKGFFKIF